MVNKGSFPDIIVNLSEADIPVERLRAYLCQGKDQQFVFMSFENATEIPEHFHEAQWEIVLDGEINRCINGKRHILTKGDTYFIPRGSPPQRKNLARV